MNRKITVEIESYVVKGEEKWSYHIRIEKGPPFVQVGFNKNQTFKSLISDLKRIKDEYV